MVTAYQADPKTGLIMLLVTPVELEILFILALRGLEPKSLDDAGVKKAIKGLELIYENFGPRHK